MLIKYEVERLSEKGGKMLKQGLVQVYTGNTSRINLAHIGLCLRATGQKLRVFVMSFLAHPFIDTEGRALSFLTPNIMVERLFLKNISPDKGPDQNDSKLISRSLERIQEVMQSNNFDIVMLEGINELIDSGGISEDKINGLIKARPHKVELVLTGSNATTGIIEQADLVTEMVEHKSEEGSMNLDGKNKRGCIEIVTGNGKGKTTYSMGRAMFFAANEIQSSILQFIKSPQAYGEVIAIEKFPNLEIKSMGKGFIFGPPKDSGKHIEAAKNAWNAAEKEVLSLEYRLIVLDEINIATNLGLVHQNLIKDLLSSKPKDMHIILSGRNAHPDIQAMASSVIEMKEIKHPFNKGIKARKGIEY
jgi:cob(I)alamin adenosyltransferase